MLPLDHIEGAPLTDIGTGGRIEAAATYLSGAIHIPREAIRLSLEIRATRVTGTPTLTCKIRQGNTSVNATLIDRGVTSPAALAAFSGTAVALMSDDVVCNYCQFEIACTGGSADVVAVAAAR